MHWITRKRVHAPLVAALAGLALSAASAVHANDDPTQTLPELAVTDAATTSSSVEISWVPPTQNADKTALTDLAGILIYYGTSASDLSRCVVVSGESVTGYTITGLSAGTWYFVAQAFTTDGGVSTLTPAVSKTIP
jgi:hypothetical protein